MVPLLFNIEDVDNNLFNHNLIVVVFEVVLSFLLSKRIGLSFHYHAIDFLFYANTISTIAEDTMIILFVTNSLFEGVTVNFLSIKRFGCQSL